MIIPAQPTHKPGSMASLHQPKGLPNDDVSSENIRPENDRNDEDEDEEDDDDEDEEL